MAEQKVVEVPMYRFLKVETLPPDEKLEKGDFQYLEEPDTPAWNPDVENVVLAKENYPRVLACMTAQAAGEWAVRRCIANGWEPTPLKIGSALASLEVDLN